MFYTRKTKNNVPLNMIYGREQTSYLGAGCPERGTSPPPREQAAASSVTQLRSLAHASQAVLQDWSRLVRRCVCSSDEVLKVLKGFSNGPENLFFSTTNHRLVIPCHLKDVHTLTGFKRCKSRRPRTAHVLNHRLRTDTRR